VGRAPSPAKSLQRREFCSLPQTEGRAFSQWGWFFGLHSLFRFFAGEGARATGLPLQLWIDPQPAIIFRPFDKPPPHRILADVLNLFS
jgi:hypothetical protein